jgi:hypothetical protein
MTPSKTAVKSKGKRFKIIHQKEHMADMTTISIMPQMWSLAVPV